MRGIVIIVITAMMTASSFGARAAPLNESTKNYLEGSWASRCLSSGANTDFNPTLQIEFHRSGGSLFYSDGIDLEARGRIVTADRQERDIVLTAYYSDDVNAHADIKRLRVMDKDRLALRNTKFVNKLVVLQRCGGPTHQTVDQLGATAAVDLTLSKRGGTYFVESANCQAKPRSWLRFDLIGPTNYFVHRWGGFGDEYLRISHASDKSGNILISGVATITKENEWQHQQVRKGDLQVRWLDNAHIRVQPWNATFLRCPD